MSVSTVPISTPASSYIFTDTAMGNTADDIKASSALVYWVQVTNSTVSAIYVKLANATSATVGTTNPDVCLMVPGSSEQTFYFVNSGASTPGLTFGTGLVAWCVTGPAVGSTNSPATSCAVSINYV